MHIKMTFIADLGPRATLFMGWTREVFDSATSHLNRHRLEVYDGPS